MKTNELNLCIVCNKEVMLPCATVEEAAYCPLNPISVVNKQLAQTSFIPSIHN